MSSERGRGMVERHRQDLEVLAGTRRLGNVGQAAVRFDDLNGLLQLPERSAVAGKANHVHVVSDTEVVIDSTTWTDIGLAGEIEVTAGGVAIEADLAVEARKGSAPDWFLGVRLLRGDDVIFDPNPTDGTGPYLYGQETDAFAVYDTVLRFPRYFDADPGIGTFTYKLQARLYQSGSSRVVTFQPNNTGNAKSTLTLTRPNAAVDDVRAIYARLQAIVTAIRTRRGR